MSAPRQDGNVLFGQLYDQETGTVTPFTQEMQNCNQGAAVDAVGDDNTEVIPNDYNSSQVKVFDTEAQEEELLGLFYGPVFTTLDNIRLPDELRGITVTFTQSSGEGEDQQDGGGLTGTGPLSLSASAKASSSAGITADVQPNIRPHFLDNFPANLYVFYAKSGEAAQADILAKLLAGVGSTVNAWPRFFPDPISLAVFGENISVSANGSAQQSLNSSGSLAYTTGAGKSVEVQPSVRSLDLSATLHRTIAITNKSSAVNIDVSAGVGWTTFGSFTGRTGGASVPTQIVNGSVSPTLISATSPSQIPVTGLYLYSTRVSQYKKDLFTYVCTVVNAADFQSPIIDFNYNDGEIALPDGTPASIGPDFHGGFPDSYALQSGSFTGSGLTLNTSTGIISGTTLGATVVTVVIRATNALGFSDATLEITVQT